MKTIKAMKKPPGLYDEVEHPEYGRGSVVGFNVKDQLSQVQFESQSRWISVNWKGLQVVRKWTAEHHR
jgi:hypothetical protein